MQAAWRVYLVSALVAGVVAAATALVTIRFFAPSGIRSPDTLILEGVADMPWGAELEVFYKTPFAVPPNLSFPEGTNQCQVTDQKAGSFKLKRGEIPGDRVARVKWKAEGQPLK